MESNSDANASREPATTRAALDALVREYSRRYIASSPRRIEHLLLHTEMAPRSATSPVTSSTR